MALLSLCCMQAEPSRFSKKVGFAVKDEIGEALKQPHVAADDDKPRKKTVIVRPPPTPGLWGCQAGKPTVHRDVAQLVEAHSHCLVCLCCGGGQR